MVSEASLLIQSKLATSVCNLESDGRDEHSTAQRSVGWTEVWGASENELDDEQMWALEENVMDR